MEEVRSKMVQVKYKGNQLPLDKEKKYNARLLYDDDMEYVYIRIDDIVKVYDGREEMQKDWEVYYD